MEGNPGLRQLLLLAVVGGDDVGATDVYALDMSALVSIGLICIALIYVYIRLRIRGWAGDSALPSGGGAAGGPGLSCQPRVCAWNQRCAAESRARATELG